MELTELRTQAGMKNPWRGRRVALVGLGVSNRALARFLKAKGADVVGFDVKPAGAIPEAAAEMRRLGIPLVTGEDYLQGLNGRFEAVFLTPGIRRTQPELARLRDSGVTVSSEMALFFQLCRAPIIGVTGSSGKTTTTTLIARMLQRGDRPVWLGGNIGRPLIEAVEQIPERAWVVLELSSFQLEFLEKSPHIGVVTNFSPNHLDVHPDLQAYWEAKSRLFRFQAPGDWAVYNADDEGTGRMVAASLSHKMGFSRRRPLGQGAYVSGDEMVVRWADGRLQRMAKVQDVQIPGRHNVENVLAAVAVAALCGVEAEKVAEALRTFQGVSHRLETVAIVDGVRFVNDSIATSPSRTAAALDAFSEPVILIAGGYDKKLSFEPLVDAVARANVKAIVLLGETAPRIDEALHTLPPEQRPPTYRVGSLHDAVAQARALAESGDVVLLSPACASYDMFNNFEERGNAFRRIVQGSADLALSAETVHEVRPGPV